MANGAPLKSVSFNGREYRCAGDAAGAFKQGGWDGELTPNGDSTTARNILTPVVGNVPDQAVEIDITTDDLEYLISLKNSGAKNIDVVWTYFGDIAYGAACAITGELTYDPMSATAPVSWSWSGEADKL